MYEFWILLQQMFKKVYLWRWASVLISGYFGDPVWLLVVWNQCRSWKSTYISWFTWNEDSWLLIAGTGTVVWAVSLFSWRCLDLDLRKNVHSDFQMGGGGGEAAGAFNLWFVICYSRWSGDTFGTVFSFSSSSVSISREFGAQVVKTAEWCLGEYRK